MSIILEQGNMSDEEYGRLLAEQIERESMPRMIKLGLVSPSSQRACLRTTTNLEQLHENNVKLHQDAYTLYMQNPHYCLNCGALIPYERRRSVLCCDDCKNQYHSKQLTGRTISPLTEEERIAKHKAYMKHYRATHKDRKRIHDHNYYLKHKPELDKKHRQYAIDHAEQTAEYQRNYREEHKKEISAQRAQHYAENKLGLSTCPNCGHDFLVTNRSTPLCQECVKAAYALGKNDSTYNPGKPYREILRKAGRLTPELDNENWHAHHIDGVRDHDVNENFVILTKADHIRLHNLYRAELKKCMEKGVMPPSLATFTWQVIREYNMEYH